MTDDRSPTESRVTELEAELASARERAARAEDALRAQTNELARARAEIGRAHV